MAERQAATRLRFFETGQHRCSYLPEQWARSLVVDPRFPADQALYTLLARHGFRRSGDHIYRPACAACAACVPVRLAVGAFRPRRSQRRVARRNADLHYQVLPGEYRDEHFALYRRYQGARHADGDMARHSPADYQSFLLGHWCQSVLLEMRLGDALLGVAVIDVLDDGLSSVYTYFAPEAAGRSLGVQAVLWAVDEARRRDLDYLYLGYWIAASRKMAYKSEYLPQERLLDGQWQRG